MPYIIYETATSVLPFHIHVTIQNYVVSMAIVELAIVEQANVVLYHS